MYSIIKAWIVILCGISVAILYAADRKDLFKEKWKNIAYITVLMLQIVIAILLFGTRTTTFHDEVQVVV